MSVTRRTFLGRLAAIGALAPLAPIASRLAPVGRVVRERHYPGISWVSEGPGAKQIMIDNVVFGPIFRAGEYVSQATLRALVSEREAIGRAAGATWEYVK